MSGVMQVFMGGSQMPAHLAAAFEGESNIKEKFSLPVMSIAGKKFTMRIGGEETILTKTEDGERVNLSFINVVVIDQNPNRSRSHFATSYVSGENQVPACYSSDGKVPDADVPAPCATTCASCPNSVKGSRIKEGREGYACETRKRLAIWPAAMLSKPDLNIPVLQLTLPITSIWDKENKQNDAEGWFAWDNYVDMLKGMGVQHTAQVVTRIKFDNSEYPKLVFKAVRWLDDAEHQQFNELAAVKGVIGTDEVKRLLHGREAGLAPTTAAVAIAAKAAAPEREDDGFEQMAPAAKATPAPAAETKPKAAAKPKATAAAAPAAEPSKPAAEVKPVSGSATGLGALAAEWD